MCKFAGINQEEKRSSDSEIQFQELRPERKPQESEMKNQDSSTDQTQTPKSQIRNEASKPQWPRNSDHKNKYQIRQGSENIV